MGRFARLPEGTGHHKTIARISICRQGLAAVALGMAVAAAGALTLGCAVSESDVHRWETTENGPEKLYAIVTHDKYSWPLREEAALSLVRMKSRNGRRVGLEYLVLGYDSSLGKVQGALSALSEDGRRKMLKELTPKLVTGISQPPPPKAAEGTAAQPDASIPYKDAAFAILSHDPPLSLDDQTKGDLTSALTQWVQTDFEDRIDNTSQQFGVEQIMRQLGAPSVKSLPSLMTLDSAKTDKATQLVADIGDDETKKRASEALVNLAKTIDSSGWLDKQRALINQRNALDKVSPKPEQIAEQLKNYQEQELEKVFINMKKLGGRPVIDYCLGYAKQKDKSEKMRTDALAALENRIDKSNPNDVAAIFGILSDDAEKSDKVRGVALARLGELPKEMIVSKLYSLFEKKWQIRNDAAGLVLKTMSTKDVPDFMKHLPENAKTKMGLSEPINYGARIMAMDPQGGPKPRDVLNTFLQSPSLGAKLTALGSFYQAKKAEAGSSLTAAQDDKTPLPKCDQADECGWSCDVPKAPGSQEKETKPVTTVGEFVKYCVEPSLQ
jgi:hypothetical protein